MADSGREVAFRRVLRRAFEAMRGTPTPDEARRLLRLVDHGAAMVGPLVDMLIEQEVIAYTTTTGYCPWCGGDPRHPEPVL